MKTHFFFIGLFALSLFASTSVVFADGECTPGLSIGHDTEEGVLTMPCVQVFSDAENNTYSVEMLSQRGNSMNWEVKVVNTSTIESSVAVNDPCTAMVKLNGGKHGSLYLECINYEGNDYDVLMKQRGSSTNWAVIIAAPVSQDIDEEAEQYDPAEISSSACVPANEHANNCKNK